MANTNNNSTEKAVAKMVLAILGNEGSNGDKVDNGIAMTKIGCRGIDSSTIVPGHRSKGGVGWDNRYKLVGATAGGSSFAGGIQNKGTGCSGDKQQLH